MACSGIGAIPRADPFGAFSAALRRPTRGPDQERPHPPSAPSPASGRREDRCSFSRLRGKVPKADEGNVVRGRSLSLLISRGPPRARRGREGKSPQGHAQDARAFAVRPWMACQRTSAAASRSRPSADRALGGALLFGYFLLGKQEKVTRSPGMASEKTQGREAGFAKNTKPKQRHWIPAFAGMTEWGSVRREEERNQHHPHPTLPLKGRAKARPSARSPRESHRPTPR
jgi:hypothetical protein